ncbi:MAG: hypothetical protein ACOX8U_07615 [Bradymonadia bacterium]|jgi:uncharacterized membrane protein
MSIHSIFEIVMLLCFGFAWPFSIMKSWRAKTAAGKSLLFLLVIILGYIAGIIKCLSDPSGTPTLVLCAYSVNACMVSFDTVLYFRNLRIDKNRVATVNA